MNDHLAQWDQQGTEGSTAMGWMGMRVPRDQMTGMATDGADAASSPTPAAATSTTCSPA